MNKVLEIKNLTLKTTNGKTLVDNISFYLKQGEILGILGESGSGKSITVNSIIKLLPTQIKITEGKILLSNENGTINILELNNKEIKRIRGGKISIIFQEPMTSFNPRLKLGHQVEEVLKIHKPTLNKKERKKLIYNFFSEVKILEYEKIYNSYPFEVSGGQKQRVMIAMALIAQPSIIVADEPTTAVDITIQRKIIDLLKKLKEKHKISLIFISHDIGVLANVTDRLMVMYKGKIVETGATNEILKSPSHPYTQGLIACRPPINNRPYRLPTVENILKGIKKNYKQNPIQKDKILTSKNIIEIKKLSVSYTIKKNILGKPVLKHKVLKDIDLTIKKEETLGLVGESGSGKTTLGRTILKLIHPEQGQILFNNKDIFKMNKKQTKEYRKKVQLIFQDPFSSLNPRLTIGQAIEEVIVVNNKAKTKKEAKEKVQELLNLTGLPTNYYNRYPHELSGGQRQRIVIARALAIEPEFIICDEAVAALDVSVQAQILNLLNSLKENFKLTYLFISHDISVIKYFSDRIAVMKDGKIEEVNFADEIYYNPKSKYTKELWESVLFV